MTIDLSVDDDAVSTSAASETAAQKPNWLLIAAIAIALLLAWERYQDRSSPAPGPDDQTIVIDEDSHPSPAPVPADVSGSTLIFVYEGISPSASQVEVMTSVSTASLQSRNLKGFRRYDQQQFEVAGLVDYAASKNISAPFVALVRDKQPLRIAAFPASPSALEAFLK